MPRWLRTILVAEPAMIRAVATSIVAVLVVAGVTSRADADPWVDALLGLLAALAPIVQGLATRAAVVPLARWEAATEGARPDTAQRGNQ